MPEWQYARLIRPEKQKLAIAFATQNGRFNYFGTLAPQGHHSRAYLLDGRSLDGLISNNATLSDLVSSCFKLRFDEHDNLPSGSPFRAARKSRWNDRRKHQGCGNERYVHHDEIDSLSDLLAR